MLCLVNKKYSEDFFINKIQESFSNEKPLHGLNERKLLKYYKENMDIITPESKKIFEEYILKADLYNNLIKRKNIIYTSLFLGVISILISIFIFIFIFIDQNFLISFILIIIEYILAICLLIKLLRFFKKRKANFRTLLK